MIYSIFSYYDKLITGVPASYAGLLSLVILALLIWALYRLIKGNYIWIMLIIVFIPATWPALKSVGRVLLIIAEFLVSRIKI